MSTRAYLTSTPSFSKFLWWSGGLICIHAFALALVQNQAVIVTASNAAQLVACGLALFACVDARRRAGAFGRSFWTLCGLSYLLWIAAQSVWTYKEFRYGVEATGHYSFTDVMFFFAFAPFAMLLLADPAQEGEKINWERTLDVMQVGIVILSAYLYFFYVPSRWETEEQTMLRMVNQVFFARNLVIIGALGLRTALSTSRRERSLFLTATLAMVVYTAVTRLSNYARIAWDARTGSWFDLGWTVPFALSAVIIASWRETDEPENIATSRPSDRIKRLLVLHGTPMLLPGLVLVLGASIAAEQVAVASLAILASFLCYSLRLAVMQHRQSKATEELARAEERFRTVFSSNPQPSWVYDHQTLDFLEVNQAAVRQYGYSREEFLGMKVTAIRPPDEAERFLARQRTWEPYAGEWRHQAKDGRIFTVNVLAQPLELAGRQCKLVIAEDITEKHRVEAHLRHAQKMEAVGTLAGGIAHDFNTALTIITGYAQAAIERARGNEALREEIQQIDSAAQRAAALVRQLLTFSSQQMVQPQRIDLQAVIAGVEKMLRPLLGEKVELVISSPMRLGKIHADPRQIEQILVNLALNAKDALGTDPPPGSRLSFLTENIELMPELAQGLKLAPGPYVLLTVSDTGCGIDKAIQHRIFEPFFTTKPGGGFGLGLSSVYGMVQQCGGAITVESEPGQGATFKIYLPLAEEESGPHRQEGRAVATSGKQTILVAEDDAGLRELATRVLSRAGYQVYTAGRHDEAEEICRQHGSEIDLLVTDVVMPEVSGKELADRLTSRFPRLRVLFMSGYTDEVVVKQGVREGSVNFIPKPFTPSALTQKVREVLAVSAGVE